jgi:hypothetical protein
MAGRSSRLRCSDCPPGALGGLRSPGLGYLGVQERCIDFAACQLFDVERQSRRRFVLALDGVEVALALAEPSRHRSER